MATAAGINMRVCLLHEENGRAHFLTKRFDRLDDGTKLHMQSLAALKHFDFNLAGAYSYEQAIQVIRQLGLSMADIEQQFVRAAFNVITRNQDDHVKNIAFLMNRSGEWRLSPAFDVVYAFNPDGAWTAQHQMSLNGKRDNFNHDDLTSFARSSGIKKRRAQQLLDKIAASVSDWPGHARRAGVPYGEQQRIATAMRQDLVTSM
jgi:serine/threonine-protein kinase HipA